MELPVSLILGIRSETVTVEIIVFKTMITDIAQMFFSIHRRLGRISAAASANEFRFHNFSRF